RLIRFPRSVGLTAPIAAASGAAACRKGVAFSSRPASLHPTSQPDAANRDISETPFVKSRRPSFDCMRCLWTRREELAPDAHRKTMLPSPVVTVSVYPSGRFPSVMTALLWSGATCERARGFRLGPRSNDDVLSSPDVSPSTDRFGGGVTVPPPDAV